MVMFHSFWYVYQREYIPVNPIRSRNFLLSHHKKHIKTHEIPSQMVIYLWKMVISHRFRWCFSHVLSFPPRSRHLRQRGSSRTIRRRGSRCPRRPRLRSSAARSWAKRPTGWLRRSALEMRERKGRFFGCFFFFWSFWVGLKGMLLFDRVLMFFLRCFMGV